MKRLSAFVTKAGDMVQQASDELQRRQQEQQYKTTPSSQASGYSSQQQYHSSSSSHQQHYSQYQTTPALPPRQDLPQTHGVSQQYHAPGAAHHYYNPSSLHQYQQPLSPQSPSASNPASVYYSPPPPPPRPSSHHVAPVQEPVNLVENRIQTIQKAFEAELQQERQRAQKIQQDFESKLESHRLEGERLRHEYETQMERSRQTVDQLNRGMAEKLQFERQQAEADAARVSVQAAEERAAVEQARLAAIQAEAETRAQQERALEAKRPALEQEERDKKRAEELAAKYQAEYEEILRQRLATAEEEERQRQILRQKEREEEARLLEENKRKEEQLAAKYQAEYDERLRQTLAGVTNLNLAQDTPLDAAQNVTVPSERVNVSSSLIQDAPVNAAKPPIPPKPASWRKAPSPTSQQSPPGQNEPLPVLPTVLYATADSSGIREGSAILPPPPPPPPPPALGPDAALRSTEPVHPPQTYQPQSSTVLYKSNDSYHIVPYHPDGPAPGRPQAEPAVAPPPPASGYAASRIPQALITLPDAFSTPAHPCGVKPLMECQNTALPLDVDYFIHDSAPSFTVCSRCYVDHIYNTQYRDAFKHIRYEDGRKVARMCLFGTHRVLRQLWPAAVRAGRLDSIIDYMKARPQVGLCPGEESLKGKEWYYNPEMPHAVFCFACYEDRIAAGPFVSHFQVKKYDGPSNCDMANWFIRRMYDAKVQTNDWAGFVAEVNARLDMGMCQGQKGVIAAHGTWYRPRQPGMELTLICKSCYVDHFYRHSYESDWVEAPRDDYNLLTCVFGSFRNLRIAARAASLKEDGSIFWRAINEVKTQEVCSEKGITNGTWYTTPNDPEEFGICGGCFYGIVETSNAGHHFIPKPGVAPGATLVCCLNPGHPRSQEFSLRLVETAMTNSPKPLSDYAFRYAKVPKCPLRKARKGEKWWGFNRLWICEECYMDFAKGTSLEAKFEVNGEVIEEARLCQLYSPRMRGMYTDVCEGRKDLEEFLEFSVHRDKVFAETVPRCEFLMFQQRMAAQNAQFYGLLGNFYSNIGGMQEISSGHDYTVGNSYAGHGYANENALQGAVYTNQAFEAGAAVTNPGPMMEVGMLEQRWLAVE